jgi:hypothetical protein
MNKYRCYQFSLIAVAALAATLLYYFLCDSNWSVDGATMIDRPAHIRPDYTDTVIPPNIAPLNFIVKEPGRRYYVRIHSTQGCDINIHSKNASIVIPAKPWKELLQNNQADKLYFDVYVKNNDGSWKRFAPITNKISQAAIDDYLVYRLIKPIYYNWFDIGIYQRHLPSYDESVVLRGQSFRKQSEGGCVNCHSFCNNRTDKMTIGIRDSDYGAPTLLAQNGKVTKIGTKFGYTAWHPTGRIVIYSLNKVRQFFHMKGLEVRDVLDLDSALAYYDLKSKTVKAPPQLADKSRLETYPTWSPDGDYLYFCSAPILWSDRNVVPQKDFEKVRYDLVRISYDIDTDSWGQLETILTAEETGKSIMLPRISPDGRFLMFCMCDYGCFPIYQPSSDLYMMDLEAARQTGNFAYRRLEVNSDRCESWHSWSSNGRWVVFSSKRRGGVFTRSYISYVDENGEVYKPLLLPQKDPTFYDSFLKTYSVPEFVIESVQTREKDLAHAVSLPAQIEVTLPLTGATPKAGPSDNWQQDRE